MRDIVDGWYYGKGTSYSNDMIETVNRVIRILLDDEIPGPIFGPSPDGTVEIEWQQYRIIVTVTEDRSSNRFLFEVLTNEDDLTLNEEELIDFIKENFN